MTPNIVAEASGHCAALWENCYLGVWNKSMDVTSFEKVHVHTKPLLDKYPKGIFLVSIVLPGTKVMDKQARALSMEQTQRLAPNLLGAVNVFMGTGLGITAFRTMVSTLTLMSRAEFPIKTVATVKEAASALAQLGASFSLGDFEGAADWLVARVSR